jgi:hypothetical protein
VYEVVKVVGSRIQLHMRGRRVWGQIGPFVLGFGCVVGNKGGGQRGKEVGSCG